MTIRVTRATYERLAGVRLPRGKREPNKWETRYAAEILHPRFLAGESVGYWFESMRLKIGEGAWYKTDWLEILANGSVIIHEVKGHMREAARVRLLAIRDKYKLPMRLARLVKGQWVVEELA